MLIVPGGGSVCLVDRFDMSGTCQSLSDALVGNTVTWAACLPGLEPGQVRVTGLVPDGVIDVTLHLSDGTQEVARATDNFYDFVTPSSNGASPQPDEVYGLAAGGWSGLTLVERLRAGLGGVFSLRSRIARGGWPSRS
jgi:hypothetical protein